MTYSIPTYFCRLIQDGSVSVARDRVADADDAAEVFFHSLAGLDREQLHVLYVNGANKIVGLECVAIGGRAAVAVTAREVFCGALRVPVSAIIVAHNHPSGDPTPSAEDIEFTNKLRQAGEIIGVQVLDALVVCPESRTFRSILESRSGCH